jgi:hypothetical protein
MLRNGHHQDTGVQHWPHGGDWEDGRWALDAAIRQGFHFFSAPQDLV